ncbi:hypothetical protein DITRI_Ditri11bG0095800 [Diplodiscus trichospermus]
MAKKSVKYYVVDAFTDSAFKGNPAAVCLLEEDKDDHWLQAVAAEFNLSETCYLTGRTGASSHTPRFRLRWFTPVTEVKLCGHATLASAYTLFTTGLVNSDIIEFDTLSGILTAKEVPDIKEPTDVSQIQNCQEHQNCFSVALPSAESVIELQPQIDDIRKYAGEGIIASGAAPMESGYDFATQCFFPKYGINEIKCFPHL